MKFPASLWLREQRAGGGYLTGMVSDQWAEQGYPGDVEYVRATPALAAVAAERVRQQEVEGWTVANDDHHVDGSLAQVASCYAHPDPRIDDGLPYEWPDSWSERWWKPKDRRSDLVRAAALILAEIERLDRAV